MPSPGWSSAAPSAGGQGTEFAGQRPGLEGAVTSAPSLDRPTTHADRFLDGLRVLGQVDDTFIIAENREGLLVIDQHVAH
ncbi:hypothetical protein ABTL61_19615, partial [Acinetobacter baumannii]